MDIFTIEFATALAAIVAIDLVLAGDNAIVIALAARNVPRHLQRRAMLFGAAGAVIVRSLLTLVVVWLLQFPGLLFAGGAMLIWIAYKLLIPEHENGELARIKGASTFWAAIRTIVVADMAMGMDNVLGVAGAAHGSFLLVILGLLISIPILVWGSSMLLKYVERYPALVYLGAGVLAFTAAKMMTSEPALKDALGAHIFTVPLVYVVTVLGVLWKGFLENHHRLESRISARLADLKRQRAAVLETSNNFEGENVMEKVLVRSCLNFCVRGAEKLVHGGGRRLRRTTDAVGKSAACYTCWVKRWPNMIANWLAASFQVRGGMSHFLLMLRSAR